MQITPFILGSGKAATAILESLRVIELAHPDISLLPIVRIKRGEDLKKLVGNAVHPVLFIANPHALHADAIIQGDAAGFKLIVCEKPAAINAEQIAKLKNIKTPVAVCHVYRQMWGMQTLKEMVSKGEFGNIISIEGRYWQSSVAQKALTGQKSDSWKNDTKLSGEADVLFDITSHWADAAIYLAGKTPSKVSIWKSFENTEAPHRDTHNHLIMDFPGGTRAMGSISKTIHGAPNHFEINVIGSKKYGCWKFLEPDLLEIAEGNERRIISRSSMEMGSGHWPHHALGWIEGYVEIIRNALTGRPYPTLNENLDVMKLLLGL